MQTRLIAFLFLLGLTLSSQAQETLPPWNSDSSKAWWAQNPAPDLWPQAAKTLESQLDATYRKAGVSSFSQPDFEGWMDHLESINLGLACPDLLADAKNLATFVALGKDDAVSHLFVEKLDPLDVKKQALQNLILLDQANSDDLHEYAALGVAYSLVFDQRFPDFWPHPQVAHDAVPIGNVDVVERFNFYVQANRNKKTALDLTQLSFENLKFLVDSEVRLSEFEYAQNNHLSYGDFANAFFSITYNESRVQSTDNMVLSWDLPTYTLKDIETHGGICVDQAYYACTLGKGRGIPTIFFTGQGSGGGHAWFGYLSHDGRWELDCGRYASQNYPKGFAVDPQTWQPIDDTTLTNLFKNGDKNPNYQPAMTALAWARLQADDPSYYQILEDARSIMPEWAGTWKMESAWLEKNKAGLDQQKTFYQAWITQFTSFPDMKVEGQQHLLAALKQANDPDAESLQRDIILENRSTGFDLGIKGSFSAISDKIATEDWEGARLEFQKAVRDFKDQGGGTFFNDVIEPYTAACVQHGQGKQAEDGLKFAEDRIAIDSGSILAVEFTRLKKNLQVAEKVLPDVNKWLGEMDDGNYEQSWNETAKSLQERIPSSEWTGYLDHVRKPLGKCTSRELAFMPQSLDHFSLGMNPPVLGNFFYAQYNSVFETQSHVTEEVIFQKGDDGPWIATVYQFKVRKNKTGGTSE
ncbi:MAG TPA: DUF4019 domain-containing protein [Candidatus Methylacidiphilales bacterium]